ncbi:peptidase T [Liquorilactobacillus capillatus]|uniref:Peptidase T n=1 Tax=Liquorilactobacillus capillatus DSM 19910 TaxID=1423731 RepID=A0A0R1M1H0_9LACO|nr:peptidase T [Liquorilactobacillus capillatus]KRL01497.1 tripeptide aminopeptidase [Liquorilactobacillus capillatus DSM 19910]
MLEQRYLEFIEQTFIKYAKVNTRSDENSTSIPTTTGQIKLAQLIRDDLREIGVKNVVYDKNDGYLVVTLPANDIVEAKPIGFIAHLDTADFPAEHIQPQVHPAYDGKDVVLNEAAGIIMRVSDFPNLKNYRGQRLITSDGTTLLGADDKAGIAAAITAIKYLNEHPNIKHGEVRFAFGPDEEIGLGAKRFDVEKFKVAFAYTLDNGLPGQLENETFNAAQAKIVIQGTAVHPGNAYGLMVNAITLANRLVAALPIDEVPEKSKGRDGFFLVTSFSATIAEAKLNIIIRDFDKEAFANKKKLLQQIVARLNGEFFNEQKVFLKITDQYHNIADTIKQHPYITDLILQVYTKLGLKPVIHPFRGGTDGNALTEKGIPTPNLFNGGENFHGQYEFVTTEAMLQVSQTILAILAQHYQNNK